MFTGNPLVRQARERADWRGTLEQPSSRFLLVKGRDVASRRTPEGHALTWLTLDEVRRLGLEPSPGEACEGASQEASDERSAAPLRVPTAVDAYVLGSLESEALFSREDGTNARGVTLGESRLPVGYVAAELGEPSPGSPQVAPDGLPLEGARVAIDLGPLQEDQFPPGLQAALEAGRSRAREGKTGAIQGPSSSSSPFPSPSPSPFPSSSNPAGSAAAPDASASDLHDASSTRIFPSSAPAPLPPVSLRQLRSLAGSLPRPEAAAAGQAVALAGWHSSARYCGRCGSRTRAEGGGSKRVCVSDARHVVFPRTDPVMIAVVESPCGAYALVGRGAGMPPGVMTCLAGFVEQAESVEEAVAREVWEEAGGDVSRVRVLATQPWPIGRGGGCELMLGCAAKVTRPQIVVDPHELEAASWVSKDEVKRALARSRNPDALKVWGGRGGGAGQANGTAGDADAPALPPAAQELLGVATSLSSGVVRGATPDGLQVDRTVEKVEFIAPPYVAIAHHLLEHWAEHDGPLFPNAKV